MWDGAAHPSCRVLWSPGYLHGAAESFQAVSPGAASSPSCPRRVMEGRIHISLPRDSWGLRAEPSSGIHSLVQHERLRSTLHLPYLWARKGQPVATFIPVTDTWLPGVGASGHMLQSCQVFCKPTALLGELSPTCKTWQRDVASPAGSRRTRLSPPGAHLYSTEAACGHAMPFHSICFSESPPATA